MQPSSGVSAVVVAVYRGFTPATDRLVPVVRYSGEVTHQWARRRLLAEWRAGRVSRDTVCDGDFRLLAASRFHGYRVERPCPICDGDDLRVVLWIFGDSLGKMSSSARSAEEIERFAEAGREFTVHTVEVCPDCHWNHLLSAREVGP